MHRRESKSCGCTEQGNPLALRLYAQFLEDMFLLFLKLFVNRLTAILVLPAFENRGNRHLQIIDDAQHALF